MNKNYFNSYLPIIMAMSPELQSAKDKGFSLHTFILKDMCFDMMMCKMMML